MFLDYALLKYRQDMHISWFDVMAMPSSVIERDIALMNFEATERPKLAPNLSGSDTDVAPPPGLG